MTAAALLKTAISIEEWLAATTFVKQRSIIHKFFFRNNYFGLRPFPMCCYLTEVSMYLSVISAVFFSKFVE